MMRIEELKNRNHFYPEFFLVIQAFFARVVCFTEDDIMLVSQFGRKIVSTCGSLCLLSLNLTETSLTMLIADWLSTCHTTYIDYGSKKCL